jgi:hypothetical protein
MPGNRTLLGVMAGLIAILAIGAAVGGSSKKAPPKSFEAGGSFRAVVVPTDRPRTVVVTPCNAPAGHAAITLPGATALRLPASGGTRTVLVPQCTAAKGTELNGTANAASAAFVLKPGEQPKVPANVTIASQSPARTIVVSPCRAGGGDHREIVLTPRGSETTAVAPAC